MIVVVLVMEWAGASRVSIGPRKIDRESAVPDSCRFAADMDTLFGAAQFNESRFGGPLHGLRLYAETSQGQIICLGEFGCN